MKSKLLKYDKLNQQLYHSIKGDFETSDRMINELLEEQPNNPKVIYNSAFIFLRNGNIKEGMKRINHGGRSAEVFGNGNLPFPILNINDVKNKTVLVNLEGGFGDNFVGLKFARELHKKGARTITLSLKPLFSLLDRQHYIYAYYNDISEIKENIDYWMPSMAAEHLFNYTNYNQLPRDTHIFYNHNNNLYNDRIKIGVKFRGNKDFDHDKYRSPNVDVIVQSLEDFRGVVEFHSLEKDNIELPNWIIKHDINDFCDTANIIQQMNFVVSTCTSIAHLSAGLGKKTIIMLPILPYWIWAYERKDKGSWYYDCVTLIRQERFGCWYNVLDEIKNVIEGEII
jgi:hypothetical protein